MPSKLFRFTYFAKNTSATPLVSHTFKTKDLKPFRFIHFQKSGGGTPLIQPQTDHPIRMVVPSEQSAFFASRLPLRGESRDLPSKLSPFHIGRCGTAPNRANYQSADSAEAALRNAE